MNPLHIILARTLTLDPQKPEAGAVLVGGGRVLAVGSREEMQTLAPRAVIHDHRGLLLTPGLTDAHIHLTLYGASLSEIDLAGTRSVAEVRAKVAARAAQTPAGEWLVGSGFLLSELGLSDYPTAADLDEVSPHHPVLLHSRDHHMLWVNSAALRLAGITGATPDPDGGHIVHPLGCLQENAQALVQDLLPQPTPQQWLDYARAGTADLAARGFVGAHTMAFEPPQAAQALQTLAHAGELPLRVWACLPHEKLEMVRELGIGSAPGALFQWGGVKFFADGALGSRTAWLHAPGFADGSGTGIALDAPELIYERGLEALALGLTPVTHAIGDRANTEVMNVYERLRPAAEARGIRLRVEHSQHLRPADIPRMCGLTSSVQPIHLQADGPMIRTLLPHLEATTYAFKALQEAGANLAFGSDAPVAPPDVQANFAAAITRRDDSGQAIAPDQALTELEVLRAYTRGPAIAAGWDDEGWIVPGARAAFTLWDTLGGAARALVL